jgi:hypothetical protein
MPKTKPFSQLADKIDADPARRARVEEHKRAMLAELRQPPSRRRLASVQRSELRGAAER